MIDRDLKHNVERALEWEPSIDDGDRGVSVEAGIVTLRGNVRSYAEKLPAERVGCHRRIIVCINRNRLGPLRSKSKRNARSSSTFQPSPSATRGLPFAHAEALVSRNFSTRYRI